MLLTNLVLFDIPRQCNEDLERQKTEHLLTTVPNDKDSLLYRKSQVRMGVEARQPADKAVFDAA